MSEVAEYVDVMEKKRQVGLELDELLERRKGLAVMSRKMTERVTDEERDEILAAYNKKVAELDSHAGRLRWQMEVLDHTLDELAKDKRWYE